MKAYHLRHQRRIGSLLEGVRRHFRDQPRLRSLDALEEQPLLSLTLGQKSLALLIALVPYCPLEAIASALHSEGWLLLPD